MPHKEVSEFLADWTDELITTLIKSQSLCVALFSTSGEVIFANESMSLLFRGEPAKSFINPTFDTLVSSHNSGPILFEGFLTLGDYSSVNTSIWAQVYRKENKILVLGGVNAATLNEQNRIMHHLNQEINNIQRELIKQKHSLEKTLIQLNEANVQLKKMNADKDRFIAILGHDLKNPFNNILGFSEILAEEIGTLRSDEIEDVARNINMSARFTNKLLEDILLWARTQQGSIPFDPQRHSFSAICSDAVEVLRPNANAKNITIDYASPDDQVVFADSDMLKLLLRNLVSNAIKFTNSGGTIRITAVTDDLGVTISVSDNGIGIPPENRAKLSNISEVITTKGTGSETGTGLGLLLCKEFVEQHRGKIWVDSEVGRGSVFRFTLPMG